MLEGVHDPLNARLANLADLCGTSAVKLVTIEGLRKQHCVLRLAEVDEAVAEVRGAGQHGAARGWEVEQVILPCEAQSVNGLAEQRLGDGAGQVADHECGNGLMRFLRCCLSLLCPLPVPLPLPFLLSLAAVLHPFVTVLSFGATGRRPAAHARNCRRGRRQRRLRQERGWPQQSWAFELSHLGANVLGAAALCLLLLLPLL
mmetsp:Transcript_131216/g.365709  ORF Transcript_131216/g.365709 Transcript_131216/m.365709 type:complete len:202 (+) Transcript_131216:205-810(+)